MKTQITFDFNTPEEAIAWMAKAFMPEDKKPKAPETAGTRQSDRGTDRIDSKLTPTPAAEGQTKRGRGRPPKKVAAPDMTEAKAPALPIPSPAAVTPVTPPPVKSSPIEAPQAAQAPAAGVPSPTDVVSALQRVLTAAGMNAAQDIFKRHGVKRGAEVKPEDRAAFIAYCDGVAKGEIDPAKAS